MIVGKEKNFDQNKKLMRFKNQKNILLKVTRTSQKTT